MSVERTTPTVSGKLTIKSEPGAYITPMPGDISQLTVSGSVGVRFLSTLIEEATALRDELRAVVG